MFNYQPLHIRSEWSLFIYNLRLLWRRRKILLLGQRINRETYAFSVAFSFAGLPLSLMFFSPLIRFGIVTRVEAIYGMYALHLVIYLFVLFVLGRRLQEWGIPQWCVLLVFGGCAWGSYYMGYPMTFDISNPFAVARGSAGNSAILNLPQYMEWTFVTLYDSPETFPYSNLDDDIFYFLQYINGHAPRGKFVNEIDTEVGKVKENKEMEKSYMTYAMEIDRHRREAKNIGIAIGREEGLRQGQAAGSQLRAQKIALSMLREQIPLNVIVKCTSLSEQEVLDLAKEHDLL